MIDTNNILQAQSLSLKLEHCSTFIKCFCVLQVIKSLGINLKDARTETEKIIGRGSGFVAVEIPFTPRAKRVLELSLEEARQLGVYPYLVFWLCDLDVWIH